ncbi:RCC1 and BTB domain-containing protein 1-like [Histomonas meleagridis]|uniref:RCC1 and BTB domain-containing protein 1-like n=1 Tax=Histomonas meleagridis TaxID=135588 RepID=UPI00355AA8A6|nr:RCC1 and BTB domain-containing protein 1-like [Histomonas meleagridis]KAH0803275.1 RCC1 and BTB domain-containing protein 1-like [Histomonas meleagridis]
MKNIKSDFVLGSFKEKFTPGSNQSALPTYGSFNKHVPVLFDNSHTHTVFLSSQGIACGFGSNTSGQISVKQVKNISLPQPIDWIPEDITISELACGDDFTILISQSGIVVIRGLENTEYNKPNPRGLSACNNHFCFSYGTSSVFLGTVNESHKKFNIPSQSPIVFTAINDNFVAALSDDGVVYTLDFNENENFTKLDIDVKIIQMCAANDSIAFLSSSFVLVLRNQNLTAHYFPKGFVAVEAVSSFGDIFALNAKGELAHGFTNESELRVSSRKFSSIAPLPLKNGQSIARVALKGRRPMFIFGNVIRSPSIHNRTPYAIELPNVSASPQIELPPITQESDEPSDSRSDIYSKSNSSISSTSSSSSDEPEEEVNTRKKVRTPEFEKLFTYNLIAGDIISSKNSEDRVRVNGLQNNGEISVTNITSNETFTLPSNLGAIWSQYDLVDRDVYSVYELVTSFTDNFPIITSKELCHEYGYEIGDLIQFEDKGIVEFMGIAANKLVLLDISTRKPFFADALEYKIMKRVTKELDHQRDVILINGDLVRIDVSSDNPTQRLFLPTDRVNTPYGEGIILGFNDGTYVQTDEMRMNGYEAVKVDVFTLKLIRRINSPANRKVIINDDDIIVSLNTDDSILGLFPGDIILLKNNKYAKVIGFTKDNKVIIQKLENDKIRYLYDDEENVQIIYRSDLGAKRFADDKIPLNVGSNQIPETLYLPGDKLKNSDFGVCEFLGYTKTNIVLNNMEGRRIEIGFAPLLVPEMFEVLQRPAMGKVK